MKITEKMEKFSVLMSLYNKENPKFLYDSLESIYNQTVRSNDVVIIYDGYINNELNEVVKHWEKRLPITIIKLKDNLGLGKALQYGLGFCKNNLIARMDTDDICFPNRFEVQLNEMIKDNDLTLLGAGIIEFDENGNERYKILPTKEKEIRKFIKIKNPFNHMCVFFRKDKVLAVGGYKHHLFMEDYNLWLRLIANRYKVRNLAAVLMRVRCGRSMIKKRRGIKYIKSEFNLLKLKISLGINNYPEGISYFIIRSLTRLIPAGALNILYSKDRK